MYASIHLSVYSSDLLSVYISLTIFFFLLSSSLISKFHRYSVLSGAAGTKIAVNY